MKDEVDLKELVSSQIQQLNILIVANDKNYNQRFEAVIEATKNALAAADRAVTKAEAASEKRFDAVNEFRATLADQQRSLMPRAEVEILVRNINEKIEILNTTSTTQQGQSVGKREGMGVIIGIAGVVSALIGILFRFL